MTTASGSGMRNCESRKGEPQPGTDAINRAAQARALAGEDMKLALAAAILIALCCSGCVVPIPHRRLHIYGMKGQVVSELDGKPIAGATAPAWGITSDDAGRLLLRPEHGWHGAVLITPAIGYSLFPHFDMPILERHIIIVSAPGYTARMFEVQLSPNELRPSFSENATPIHGRIDGSYLILDKLHLAPRKPE